VFFSVHTIEKKMLGGENFFFEEQGIDPERIVNDEYQVANEFFCAICQGLLWKSRSCASCQHLFCNKCIRTWLQINPTSCPFRCTPYEEKRPPPYIHSLLGRLSIRCRNSSYGCTDILLYDLLEQHENVECQFLTKRCRICGQYILKNEIDQHQTACIPATIQCSVCKRFLDRPLLPQHTIECFKEKLNVLVEQIIPTPEELGILTDNLIAVPQEQGNENWFTRFNNRLQRFLAAMPQVNLIGLEEVAQARELNSWARIWTMLRLIWLNKSRAMQILFFLSCFGIGFIIGFLIATSLYIQNQVEKSIYRSFAFIILFSGLFSFSLPVLLASISDTFIIVFTVISLILWSSAFPNLPLHYIQVFQSSKVLLAIYFIVFIIFKLSLLMIRLYSRCIPSYISAGCLAWIMIFVTFHIRRFSINRR
jgi:hypothetical protein